MLIISYYVLYGKEEWVVGRSGSVDEKGWEEERETSWSPLTLKVRLERGTYVDVAERIKYRLRKLSKRKTTYI